MEIRDDITEIKIIQSNRTRIAPKVNEYLALGWVIVNCWQAEHGVSFVLG